MNVVCLEDTVPCVGYQVDHRCIVCMKIKYTRGDQEIRPEWSDIYILIWEGLLATRVASCDWNMRPQ